MENSGFCSHLSEITSVTIGNTGVCAECIKTNDSWVHLRTCQQCGVTLCCDDSPNQHASKHYRAIGHPVIASAEPGERWLWCYPHEQIREY